MSDLGLKQILNRLTDKLTRDKLVQDTTYELRQHLQVDRVVLYYFYRQWEGQVTFESISSQRFSILGSTGPDECFNAEYAALYEAGRISAIADINTAPIAQCHRDFLQDLQVKANLVVPVLPKQRLWGLLIAHHCQNQRFWSARELEIVKQGAKILAESTTICGS